MSSGSFKDLSKAISASINTATLPLPDDLVQILNAYLEKHPARDEGDCHRMQDELLSIYATQVNTYPARLGPFLAILRTLKPAISGGGRLLQWWDKLSVAVLNNLGGEKGLVAEAKQTLLSILVYDVDEDGQTEAERADAMETSKKMAENLMATWLVKTRQAKENFDDNASFIEGQVQLILLAFGKRRPKDFLNTIDKFFVKKECRILALSLLCEFIRHQPPHLHQLLQTPLFENLLRCLQNDTSTRVISLAMTALIMFLPHVPSSLSPHLPALFNIYSRMLFWERERRSTDGMNSNEKTEMSEKSQMLDGNGISWVKMAYLLESDDETVPELLHYFTFLYGLYPINFMSYIRKPQRYLRHANFPGADDLDIEPSEIRERSESFRRVHLLHPNFFMLTIESELKDTNRWMRSEAADVVAECMGLFNPGYDHQPEPNRSRGPVRMVDPNSDVPDQPLLDRESVSPLQSRQTSWRNTSSMFASPDGYRAPGLNRKASQTSQSLPSIADSPSAHPVDREQLDSPTIPPQMLSPSQNPLTDILQNQRSARGSIYQSLTNESVASLSLSHNQHDSSTQLDTYLESLPRDTVPRSPTLRPANVEPTLKMAYLHREIQLLRNDLNFEKYLKAQHLSHIGQLRRKQIQGARVEAETQNLINSNRQLKSKLEEAKRTNLQMRKEGEKSKTHARKWEQELSAKLRVLREEQRKWMAEKDELKRDLVKATENADNLRQMVVTSENRELGAIQKMQSVESSLDELSRLRAEVEKLTQSLRGYEAGETFAVKAREDEAVASKRVELLEMRLRARDHELVQSAKAYEDEIQQLQTRLEDEQAVGGEKRRGMIYTQDMLDSALCASRNRMVEIQKAHNHLLKRYTALQAHYMDLKEKRGQSEDGDEALLGGGSSSRSGTWSPIPGSRTYVRRSNTIPEGHDFEEMKSARSPTRPPRLDTSFGSTTPTGGWSPIGNGKNVQFQSVDSLSPTRGRGSVDTESLDSLGNKAKIKPQSEVRIYGRGGVQNIGKNQKDKDKKEKGKEKEGAAKDGKDAPKKSMGIRGIRGFV